MYTLPIPISSSRPDEPVHVAFVGRVSTPEQNTENIEASFMEIDKILRANCVGEYVVHRYGDQVSGMVADRPSMRALLEEVIAGRIHVVMAEDAGRIYRDPRSLLEFFNTAVDHGGRIVCLADGIDTNNEDWETLLHAALLRHGLVSGDTVRRVRRTATHSFKSGGMVTKIKYGYRKLSDDEAKSGRFGPVGLKIAKEEEAQPVIDEMVTRLLSGSSITEIADWLNEQHIPPGPYVRCGLWLPKHVESLLRDPILWGCRRFRVVAHVRQRSTGRHKRVVNQEPETMVAPSLAFLTEEKFNEVVAELDRGRQERPRKRPSPLAGKPRSMSLFPTQMATCGICGGRMYKSGDFVKCSNAKAPVSTQCWNRVQLKIVPTQREFAAWLAQLITETPVAFEPLLQEIQTTFDATLTKERSRLSGWEQRIAQLEKERANLAKFIAKNGCEDAVESELSETMRLLEEAKEKRGQLVERHEEEVVPLRSMSSEDEVARALERLLSTSYEFADFLRKRLVDFTVSPVRSRDTDQLYPRVKLTLRLPVSRTESPWEDITGQFDPFRPPVHIRYAKECIACKRDHPDWSYRRIGIELGTHLMTVKRGLAYARRMEESGSADLFEEVLERPVHASRWSHPGQPPRRRRRRSA